MRLVVGLFQAESAYNLRIKTDWLKLHSQKPQLRTVDQHSYPA